MKKKILWANEFIKDIHPLLTDKSKHVASFPEHSRMRMGNGLDCLEGIDKSLLAQILKSPIAIWVSCGEPFLPLNGKAFLFCCLLDSMCKKGEISFMSWKNELSMYNVTIRILYLCREPISQLILVHRQLYTHIYTIACFSLTGMDYSAQRSV